MRRLRGGGWTVRLRLTVLYGAVFGMSSMVLVAITYVLVRHSLRSATFYATVTVRNAQPSPGTAIIGGVNLRSGPGRIAFPAGQSPPTPQDLFNQLRSATSLQRADALHTLLIISVIVLVVMLLASMGLGWMLAGRALRPIRAMTSAAQQISEHNLHERLPDSGPPDELGELAVTFNALLSRLEGAFESQRRFVANASHELRTPLTLERAIVEVALADPDADAATLRATCQRVLAIGAQQETLIEALLTLARSQRGLDRREPIDLGAIAGEVVDTLQPKASMRSITIAAELGDAHVEGDTRLVERLVTNLVDNAVRHNLAGGWVRVQTAGNRLVVANSGTRIPREDVTRLLQPFQRLPAERSVDEEGLGLGLSIVAAIAAAHGAQLAVLPQEAGGLTVEVIFPAVAVPSRPVAEEAASTV
jgi:signal transduction histidine kinase